MKQAELAKKLGISVRTLQTMALAALAAHGWEKVGKGKGTFYRRIHQEAAETEEERETLEEAKRRKMIADANLSELKSENRIVELKKQGADKYIEAVADVLRVLPEALTRMGLTAEQNETFNATIREAVERVGRIRETLA